MHSLLLVVAFVLLASSVASWLVGRRFDGPRSVSVRLVLLAVGRIAIVVLLAVIGASLVVHGGVLAYVVSAVCFGAAMLGSVVVVVAARLLRRRDVGD